MSALPETEESVDTLPALFDLLTIACDIHPTEALARVTMRGALDASTASAATAALADLAACRYVEIDVSALSFCDAAGLGCFVAASRQCVLHPRAVVLVDPAPQMTRLLELTNLTRLTDDSGV
ncbi:MAG: STAS domain-containing protein [Actinomycetota bacterium]|nr:STAS domain-containing protein [Actinomycetota bacterium]